MSRTTPEKTQRDLAMIEKVEASIPDEVLEPETNRPNRMTRRNRVIVECIRQGVSSAELARVEGISPQRVRQIWEEYGDGYNIFQHRRKLKQQGVL